MRRETCRSNSKFPDMKALADYVHSKGLKIGIYSSPGPRTCGEYPASYGHEEQDAKTFAAWGFDYLKYDWCSASEYLQGRQAAAGLSEDGRRAARRRDGRLFTACASTEWATCRSGARRWARICGARRATSTTHWESMIANIEKQVPTAPYAGPGHWNDPDMLEIGNGHMTADEYRTHMSLWALAAAPLLAGNDVRTMTDTTRSILLNKEVIAIDQDPLGKQASPVKSGDFEIWVKPLADGGVAVGVVNMGADCGAGKGQGRRSETERRGEEGAGSLGAQGREVYRRGL